ncbi:hypothetical protein Fifi067_00062 [Erwinia phage Fifi067]|nr:hypothetical protein Fifi067_00062 [Erwinia phage Fifi067]WBQ32492.1 putative ATPase [Erwinia phage Kuerle]
MGMYRVTPRKAVSLIEEILAAGLVPFMQGSPGIGKSAIGNGLSKSFNLATVDHRLSTSPPEDMNGLPYFEERPYGKVACFAPFADLFPIEGMPLPEGKDGWLVFLDEYNSAKKDTQAASYKLLLDRMTGQKKLHERVAIVLAGNLSTDRAIVNNLSTAAQSRLIHLELEVSYHDWLRDVAIAQDYDPRIIGYFSQFEEDLMSFDPKHTDKTFCCPRTVEFLNRMIIGKDVTEDRLPMYAGTVGEDIATKFYQFCNVYKDLIKYEEIMKDPLNCRLPTSLDLAWATVSGLVSKMTIKNFPTMAAYAGRLGLDMRILFFRFAMAKYPELRRDPTFAAVAVQLAKYLNED